MKLSDDMHHVTPGGGAHGKQTEASRSEGGEEKGGQAKGRQEGGQAPERPKGGEPPGPEKRHAQHWTPGDYVGDVARPASMRLSDYLQTFYEFSGKASDVLRAAAFAGIGLVWVFKLDARPVATLPRDLVLPVFWFATAITADAAQYVVAAATWFLFHTWHEWRAKGEDPELRHSRWLSVPIGLLFVGKVVATGVGYFLVIRYLLSAWKLG